MISARYVQTMARYNAWQNASIYGAASGLSDTARKEDRGAFFGSIHATLNHLLWADQMWLARFGACAAPAEATIAKGLALYEDWEMLSAERKRFDAVIESWADGLSDAALAGNLTWFSGAAGIEMTKPRALLVAHIFNHQTHHRGQVHALLTGLGAKPGVTDLPFGPDVYAG